MFTLIPLLYFYNTCLITIKCVRTKKSFIQSILNEQAKKPLRCFSHLCWAFIGCFFSLFGLTHPLFSFYIYIYSFCCVMTTTLAQLYLYLQNLKKSSDLKLLNSFVYSLYNKTDIMMHPKRHQKEQKWMPNSVYIPVKCLVFLLTKRNKSEIWVSQLL